MRLTPYNNTQPKTQCTSLMSFPGKNFMKLYFSCNLVINLVDRISELTFPGPNEIYRIPPTSSTEVGEWMKTGLPFRKTLPWAHVPRIPFVCSEMSRYDIQ